jgi:hypothetical protein
MQTAQGPIRVSFWERGVASVTSLSPYPLTGDQSPAWTALCGATSPSSCERVATPEDENKPAHQRAGLLFGWSLHLHKSRKVLRDGTVRRG